MAAIRLFVHWHVFKHIPTGQSVSYAQLSDQIAEALTKENNNRILLVDVGGGSGHAVQAICDSIGLPLEHYVLQDKEPVILRIKEIGNLPGLHLMPIDMHKEQPV
ncbi:hypothetical protein LZ31DRAFT_601339 [Colletotrichum somersetense]|nr:hypothetical protein LZ31DRAFT_601339 [Colletotrichum somersetense]